METKQETGGGQLSEEVKSKVVGSGAGFGIWFPIENAPRDGTNILTTDGEIIALVWWSDEWRDYGDIGAAGQYDFEPTHWMHLPPLPNRGSEPTRPAASEVIKLFRPPLTIVRVCSTNWFSTQRL